jgi:hypothetical protein
LPSPRAVHARQALLAAASLGILADPLLRHGPWGLGLVTWMVLCAVTLLWLAPRLGRPLSGESRAWLAVAVLFAAGLAWRDSEMLYGFDLLAMASALILLALSMNTIPVRGLVPARIRDLIQAAFGTGVDVATGTPRLFFGDAELHDTLQPANRLRRVTRAVLLAIPIVLVFTLLLTQADPLFGSIVTLPDLDFEQLFSHVLIAGFFAWIVGGWLRRALLQSSSAAPAAERALPLRLESTDVAIALGALAVLFAAFVAVQVGWLFGGEALVLRTTGLGYADYARRGFFELMWVAGLLLPVLLVAHALIPAADARAHRLFRRLSLVLTILLGAIMVSAFARMQLYIRYYGISTDRLYSTAFMIWLAIVFAWLVVTVLRARPRAFATGMVTSGFAVLALLNVINPDALVARANLARAETGRAGVAGADLGYVASLGGGAVPLLVTALLDQQHASAPDDRCAAADRLLKRWMGGYGQQFSHWTQWSADRARAMRSVRAHAAELDGIACPE